MNSNQWLKPLWKDIVQINLDLYKVMIPVIILVKIAQELGLISYLAIILAPIMSIVDLPPSMGLVWATTMISNIYGGMIVFFTLAVDESLSVAQVTTLGGMMLIAHSLPVEVSISAKTGMRVAFSLLVRVGFGLFFGFLLSVLYSKTGWLSETNTPQWMPELPDSSPWLWVKSQLSILLKIFIIIAILVSLLRFLKYSGIERLLVLLLKPLLKLTGLGYKTVPNTIVGMGLGLTYGGGLLIREAKQGGLTPREIFGSMFLLALCHGLIEDTLLVMLLGAHISGVLYLRIIFSLLLVTLVVKCVAALSDRSLFRYFMRKL